jgi:hypothetical protein
MAKEKMQHCAWCGEELGVYYQGYPNVDTCGKSECNREMRDTINAEAEQAADNARQDVYERY